jgi:diguanylate cyclase (GGDEF)-like protein
VGVACFPQDGRTLDALAARADRALYQAKQRGRNCVVRGSEEG